MKANPAAPLNLVRVRGTELLLSDTRERYRQKLARITLDSMVQFVGLLDANGTVLEINHVALDAAGIKLSEVEGKPFWTTFWWQVSNEINATLRDAIRRAAQGEFVRWDAEIYGRAGGKETIIIDASLMPVKDEQGTVVFITAEGRDITEEKAHEREIARQREELAKLDELKTEFFARIGPEFHAPLTLMKGPLEDAMTHPEGMPARQDTSDDVQTAPVFSSSNSLPRLAYGREQRRRILLADDNADMREYVQRLLSDQYEVVAVTDGESALASARTQRPDLILCEIMMPELDGFGVLQAIRAEESLKHVPVILLSAGGGEEARIEGLSSGADDYLVKPFSARELITCVGSHLAMSRIRSEAAGLERNFRLDAEMLAAIVASSDDAIVSKNLDGVITTWNKGAERIFGYTAEEAVGQHITLIIPHDRREEEADILARLRRGEKVDHFHTVRRSKDGSLLDISATISPLRDSSGRVIGASKVARDISKQKRVEEASRESEEKYRQLAETLDTEVRARTKELEERNREVLRQSDQLRELSWRLLRTQEEERRHIARELHDSAGQTLTVLGLSLAQLVENAGRSAPALATEAEMIQETVQQLHRELRTASYLLHPPLLDETGLYSALSWYVQGLVERSGLDVSLDIPERFGRLPQDLELAVFRLVQECLTNVHRHSGSKTALIRVAREGDMLTVTVEDQGKGMPPAKLAEIQSQGSGVGIRGMRERLRQFQGTMIVESDSSGTRVQVTIPIPKAASPSGSGAEPVKALA
jgi:PAS domain S-box-containing protein